MPVISPIQFALGVGAGGALVDVSAYVEFGEGIIKSFGKQDQFRDTQPGTFSVPLNNRDGRFTPNNVPTTVTATTLSASTAVGATSFTTAGSIPAGSYVVIDTGANAEVVLTGTPTGAGPFTIPVVTCPGITTAGLQIAHSSGVAVSAATSVTEGMAVCLRLGSRYTAATVLSVALPSDELTWGQITLLCDDMLGNGARRSINSLVDAVNKGATQYLLWPLADAVGTTVPAESTGNATGLLTLSGANGSAFGATAIPALGGGTQLTLKDSVATTYGANWPTFTFAYPATSLGFYSCWITPTVAASSKITVAVTFNGLARSLQFGYNAGTYFVRDGDAGTSATYSLLDTSPHFVSMGLSYSGTTLTLTLYVDGTSRGSTTYATALASIPYKAPTGISVAAGV